MAAKYVMLRQKLDALIQEYGSYLCELLNVPPGECSSPGQGYIDHRLSEFLDSYYFIRERLQQKALSVAVTALTKSGKSTFFNALLASDCMPTGTVPETARICRIIHNPLIREPEMDDNGQIYKGAAAVNRRLHELNTEVRQRDHCIYDEDLVTISAPLAALAEQPPMPTELHLIDTPGPNEAGEEGLKYQVERLLDGIGVVVYLLDCTKLKTAEEKDIFQRLQEINPQLMKRLSERLFFVVNKKDMLGSDMGPDQVKQYVADLVTSQIGNGEFHLDANQVLLISAKQGLYSRMIMMDKASDQQQQAFALMAFGRAGYLKATVADMKQAAPELFLDSGIEEVESKLLGFLYSKAGRLQMLGTIDDTAHHLSRVMNSVAASHAALQSDYVELKAKVANMTLQFDVVKERFAEVGRITSNIETDVIDEIKGRMHSLKMRLFEQVNAVMSESQSNRLPPRWKSIWSKIREIITLSQLESATTENDAQNSLVDLYLSINTQMEDEVRAFWHDLEVATNNRQQQVFSAINKKLQELASEVEGVVSYTLNVTLQPANITIQPPSYAQHHEDLRKLFSQGMMTTTVTREVENKVHETVIEKHYHVPLCKLGEYYVSRPVVQTHILEVVDTIVRIDPEKVKQFFIEHVEATVDGSIGAVRGIVHNYMKNQVEAARMKLDQYCTSYVTEMSIALQENSKSELDRRVALEKATNNLAALTAIHEQLQALTSLVEGADTDEEGDFFESGSECDELAASASPQIRPVKLERPEDSFMSVTSDVGLPVSDGNSNLQANSQDNQDAPPPDNLLNNLAMATSSTSDVVSTNNSELDKAFTVDEEAVDGHKLQAENQVQKVEDGHSDRGVDYPDVEPMEPLPPVTYPNVEAVHTQKHEPEHSMTANEDTTQENGGEIATAAITDVDIQMEGLPLSRKPNNLSASYPGPFNYEEAFHECMSMSAHEDIGDKETDGGFVLLN